MKRVVTLLTLTLLAVPVINQHQLLTHNIMCPDIDENYKKELHFAESNLNLHGYTIDQILSGRDLPQTKAEIKSYDNGKDFHLWLQEQADVKFKHWQVKITLVTLVPSLLALTSGVVIFSFWKYNNRSNRLVLKKYEF